MRGATVRIAALVMLVAAGVVVFAVLGLTWYEHTASGRERTAWYTVPEVGVDLALAGVAGVVGLGGVALGARLPRVAALLALVAALGLTALLAYRLGEQPSLWAGQRAYTTEPGPFIALVAAAVLCTASLLVAITTVVLSGKTCPDCAERIARNALSCPHCGREFAPPRGWKRCPNCRGVVRQQARVCMHCRHDLMSQA